MFELGFVYILCVVDFEVGCISSSILILVREDFGKWLCCRFVVVI